MTRRPPVTNDEGFGRCDGCGIPVPYSDLRAQITWAGEPIPLPNDHMCSGFGLPVGGNSLTDTGLRHCSVCWSPPDDLFRPLFLPADPIPYDFPRPDTIPNDTVRTESELTITTENGVGLIP